MFITFYCHYIIFCHCCFISDTRLSGTTKGITQKITQPPQGPLTCGLILDDTGYFLLWQRSVSQADSDAEGLFASCWWSVAGVIAVWSLVLWSALLLLHFLSASSHFSIFGVSGINVWVCKVSAVYRCASKLTVAIQQFMLVSFIQLIMVQNCIFFFFLRRGQESSQCPWWLTQRDETRRRWSGWKVLPC